MEAPEIAQEVTNNIIETKEFIELIKNGSLESTVNTYENSIAVMEILDEARKQIGLKFPADR